MAETLNRALEGQKRGKMLRDGAQAHLLTSFEIGAFLRVSRWTLKDWRKAGKGPPYVKLSRHVVRYPVVGLKRFLNQHLGPSSLGQIPLFGGSSRHGEEIGDVSASAETAS
jgi:hypothetical protein